MLRVVNLFLKFVLLHVKELYYWHNFQFGSITYFDTPLSGVARVAELRGQVGGKGLYKGGKHIREPEGPTLYREEVSELLKAPSS